MAQSQNTTGRFLIELFQQRIADLSADRETLKASIAELTRLQELADTRRAELLAERQWLVMCTESPNSTPHAWPTAAGIRGKRLGETLAETKDAAWLFSPPAPPGQGMLDLLGCAQRSGDAIAQAQAARDADFAALLALVVPRPEPGVVASPDETSVPQPRWSPTEAAMPVASTVGLPAASREPVVLHNRFHAEVLGAPLDSLFSWTL